MNCGICGGATVEWLDMPVDAKKDEVTPFRKSVRCGACGTGTIEPKPTPADISDLYVLPEYYTHGGSHMPDVPVTFLDKILIKLAWWSDKERPFDPRQLSDRLKRTGRVLDIGCGDGALLERFQKLGHDVIGVDPDPDARREAALRNVIVLTGTGESLPTELPEESFDLVVMSHSLEHCLNPVAAIQNARSKVRPGGFLYIEVPNCGCIHFETMLTCSENYDSPRHLWFFTEAGLNIILKSAGLSPVGLAYHGMTRHHMPSWRAWESMIADRTAAHGFRAGRKHGYIRSIAMLVREFFAAPQRKYDAIGMWAVA